MSMDDYERRHMGHTAYYEGGSRLHTGIPDGKYYPSSNNHYGSNKDIFAHGKPKKQFSESAGSQNIKDPKEAKDVFIRFADTTSLQGIPFIKRASKWYAKVLWSILFVAATAAWLFHSTYLIQTYIQYDTSSSVAISYEKVPFPSVSFCNINPIRPFQLPKFGSPELKQFIDQLKPKSGFQYPGAPGTGNNNGTAPQQTGNGTAAQRTGGPNETRTPPTQVTGNQAQNNGSGPQPTGVPNDNTRVPSDPQITRQPPGDSQTGPNRPSGGPVNNGRRKLLNIDTYNYEYTNYVDQSPMYISNDGINWTHYAATASDDSGIISDSGVSTLTRSFVIFKDLIANLPESNRSQLGHSLTEMMVSCSYNGESCTARNFTRFLDINYGNCWTFNSAGKRAKSMFSQRGGSNTGLDIMLNIQDNKYMRGLNIGRGLRLHLHPFKTVSVVEDNGISISPGKQTYVGLRMINQTRLGGKYGACNDDKGRFTTYYNNSYIYTLEGCIHTCIDRSIVETCKCYRKTKVQLHPVKVMRTLNPCSSIDEKLCAKKKVDEFNNGQLTCGCNQACNTIEYESMATTDVWPDETLWYSLVDAVCVRDATDCEYFRSTAMAEQNNVLRSNFIHLKVYYRDLNVQKIVETAQYDLPQFASDIGGAVGLWLGASAITLLELFDLSCQLCRHCARKDTYKARKAVKQKHEQSLPNSINGTHRQHLPRSNFERSRYYEPYNYA